MGCSVPTAVFRDNFARELGHANVLARVATLNLDSLRVFVAPSYGPGKFSSELLSGHGRTG